MNRYHSLAAACTLALACSAQSQTAQQTQAPKSQAKPPSIVIPPSAPAKPGAPKTLGGKAPAGKMLNREELRACLKRLDAINTTTKSLEPRRVALDKEKDEIVKEGDALKAELAEVNVKLAQVRDWETRSKAHSAEVDAFNAKMQTADQVPRNQREAFKAETDAERERLTKARTTLEADSSRLVPAYQAAAKAYNDKAQGRDGVVEGWNQRNRTLNEEGLKLDEERQSWLAECANRPYREDDEVAIKSGK